MRLSYHGISDVGLIRSNNEDMWTALPEFGFFAVADGMGGHQAGEIASQEALSSLCESIKAMPDLGGEERMHDLCRAIEKANNHIVALANSQKTLAGMGTTLCCLLWSATHVIYAHVGDSRIYRLRHGMLELLTEDHSFLTKWKAYKDLSGACETPYPYRHVITRAIGMAGHIKPTISMKLHRPGDLYLLCTDGLTDVIEACELEFQINQAPNLETACAILVEMAKMKGSSDNITLLIVQSEGLHAKNLFR